jgi:hypothetical protein
MKNGEQRIKNSILLRSFSGFLAATTKLKTSYKDRSFELESEE